MPESALSISYSELLVEVGTYLGYNADPTTWAESQTAEVDRYIQAGLRQFYYPPASEGVEAGYEWSFLKPSTTIETTADDAAQDLPDDLGRVLGDFFYESSEHRQSITLVSEHRILSLLSRSEDTGAPQVACVRHKAGASETEGQRLEVAWWPIPDTAYTLTYQYEAYSGKLSESNPYPLGGMKHSGLVLASCLAIAEQRGNDEKGIHADSFHRLLIASIALDRKQGARYYGPMGVQKSTCPPRHGDTGSNYPITYKGETW